MREHVRCLRYLMNNIIDQAYRGEVLSIPPSKRQPAGTRKNHKHPESPSARFPAKYIKITTLRRCFVVHNRSSSAGDHMAIKVQRGRKSQGALTVISGDSPARISPRISPPETLLPAVRDEFIKIVNSLVPEHFRESDATLLARYCQVLVACNNAGDTSEFCQLTKLQISLATKLRLCPSTRGHPRTTANQLCDNRSKPWEDSAEVEI